jgi:hypothetical protein
VIEKKNVWNGSQKLCGLQTIRSKTFISRVSSTANAASWSVSLPSAEFSSVSLPTVKRLEAKPGNLAAPSSAVAALVGALEAAGVEFTNGEQPGVGLAKAAAARSAEPVGGSNPTAAAKAPRRKTAKATEKKR